MCIIPTLRNYLIAIIKCRNVCSCGCVSYFKHFYHVLYRHELYIGLEKGYDAFAMLWFSDYYGCIKTSQKRFVGKNLSTNTQNVYRFISLNFIFNQKILNNH